MKGLKGATRKVIIAAATTGLLPDLEARGCIHRAFVSRVNTNETLVFLNTWFSHPKDLVFCALTKAIHKDLEENQVFQVRGFFKLGFCLVLEKQAIVCFSSDCSHF